MKIENRTRFDNRTTLQGQESSKKAAESDRLRTELRGDSPQVTTSNLKQLVDGLVARNGLSRSLKNAFKAAIKSSKFDDILTPYGRRRVYRTDLKLGVDNALSELEHGFVLNADGTITHVVIKRASAGVIDLGGQFLAASKHELDINQMMLERSEFFPENISPVVAVYRGESVQDSYIATEFIPGDSLLSTTSGKLSGFVRALANSANGFAALQRQGISHMDIHGENVRADGTIIDFGLSLGNENNLQKFDDSIAKKIVIDLQFRNRNLFEYYTSIDPFTGQIRGVKDRRADMLQFSQMIIKIMKERTQKGAEGIDSLPLNAQRTLGRALKVFERMNETINQSLVSGDISNVPTFEQVTAVLNKVLIQIGERPITKYEDSTTMVALINRMNFGQLVSTSQQIQKNINSGLNNYFKGSLLAQKDKPNTLQALQEEELLLLQNDLFEQVVIPYVVHWSKLLR